MPIITALLSLAGVWFGTYLNSKYSSETRRVEEIAQSRRRAYAEIQGRQLVFWQFHAFLLDAEAKYILYSQRIALGDSDPTLRQELAREAARHDALLVDATRAWQNLFESMALARISFSDTAELRVLLQTIYDFSPVRISSPRAALAVAALNQWSVDAQREASNQIEIQFKQPVKKLLAYLLTQIDCSDQAPCQPTVTSPAGGK